MHKNIFTRSHFCNKRVYSYNNVNDDIGIISTMGGNRWPIKYFENVLEAGGCDYNLNSDHVDRSQLINNFISQCKQAMYIDLIETTKSILFY